MVGIGETGLDYHYTGETKDVQQESLRVHIEAAVVCRVEGEVGPRDRQIFVLGIMNGALAKVKVVFY